MSNMPKIRPTGIKWPAPRDRSVKISYLPYSGAVPTADDWHRARDISHLFRDSQFGVAP